jgi:large conductance mechanosensitive channel
MNGFIKFIREQGVIGFATGFILGGAVSNLVGAFVKDIVNPVIGVFLNQMGNLENAVLKIGPVNLAWGDFVSTLINFLILAFVVYFLFKVLKLEKLDVKEEAELVEVR